MLVASPSGAYRASVERGRGNGNGRKAPPSAPSHHALATTRAISPSHKASAQQVAKATGLLLIDRQGSIRAPSPSRTLLMGRVGGAKLKGVGGSSGSGAANGEVMSHGSGSGSKANVGSMGSYYAQLRKQMEDVEICRAKEFIRLEQQEPLEQERTDLNSPPSPPSRAEADAGLRAGPQVMSPTRALDILGGVSPARPTAVSAAVTQEVVGTIRSIGLVEPLQHDDDESERTAAPPASTREQKAPDAPTSEEATPLTVSEEAPGPAEAVALALSSSGEEDSEDEEGAVLNLSPLRALSSAGHRSMSACLLVSPVSPVPSTDAAVDLLAAAARTAMSASTSESDAAPTCRDAGSLTPPRQGLADMGAADAALCVPAQVQASHEADPKPNGSVDTDSDADSDASTQNGDGDAAVEG